MEPNNIVRNKWLEKALRPVSFGFYFWKFYQKKCVQLRKLRLFFLKEINDICNAIDKCEEENGIGTITPAEFWYLQKLYLVRLITFNPRSGAEVSNKVGVMKEQWKVETLWGYS